MSGPQRAVHVTPGVKLRLEVLNPKPAPPGRPVVVLEIEIAIGDEALRNHEVMRLVARIRELPMRRQRPDDEDDEERDAEAMPESPHARPSLQIQHRVDHYACHRNEE